MIADGLPRGRAPRERVESVRLAPPLAEAVRRIESERGLDGRLAGT